MFLPLFADLPCSTYIIHFHSLETEMPQMLQRGRRGAAAAAQGAAAEEAMATTLAPRAAERRASVAVAMPLVLLLLLQEQQRLRYLTLLLPLSVVPRACRALVVTGAQVRPKEKA